MASQHLSFRVISLYAPKAAKLLDQEKLSIEWADWQRALQTSVNEEPFASYVLAKTSPALPL